MHYTKKNEYLIHSSRGKCKKILEKTNLNENDIIELFLYLHLILEISINYLLSYILKLKLNTVFQNEEDILSFIEQLETIPFSNKILLFISYSTFQFKSEEKENMIKFYKKLPGIIREFTGIRNKLLHGHNISETGSVSTEGGTNIIHTSKIKKELNQKKVNSQVLNFYKINKIISIFILKSDSSLTISGRNTLINSYLDTSFIPEKYYKN